MPKMELTTFIGDYLHNQVRMHKGDIGVEVEVEGLRLPNFAGDADNQWWNVHADHSLRGEALEYVFLTPKPLDQCSPALAYLERKLRTPPTVVDENSPRTSVHIHKNRQSWRVQEIYTHASLYFIFEALMARFAGNHRVGNMYCLGASDAEFLPILLVQSLTSKKYLSALVERQQGDEIRYSGLNFASLFKFGSAEYRLLRGTIDAKEILRWIAIIESLERKALGFANPLDVWVTFNDLGYADFLRHIFSENKEFLEFCFGWTNTESLMREGALYAFEIAHAVKEWPSLKSKSEARAERKKQVDAVPVLQERYRYWREDIGYGHAIAEAIARHEVGLSRVLDPEDQQDSVTLEHLVQEFGNLRNQNRPRARQPRHWDVVMDLPVMQDPVARPLHDPEAGALARFVNLNALPVNDPEL